MKQNYETCLVGQTCVLVPYRSCHVERYHEWMKSPELLAATGSEPLSLQEEYDMQQSWRDDPAKCTFIVLNKAQCRHLQDASNDNAPAFVVEQNLEAMVGDVNLFLSEIDDEEEEDNNDKQQAETAQTKKRIQAEVDIMVAEPAARGKGIGKEATALMIQYGTTVLHVERFFVKINQDNTASRSMFEHRLKFQECDYAACFQQYEYELFRSIVGDNEEDDDKATIKTSGDAIDDVLGTRRLVVLHCAAADAA